MICTRPRREIIRSSGANIRRSVRSMAQSTSRGVRELLAMTRAGASVGSPLGGLRFLWCSEQIRALDAIAAGWWPPTLARTAGRGGADADLLEAAAWLHDIGYAPDLTVTGLLPLDGARYLRDAQHADATLCRPAAHHLCAIIEAEERGLAEILGLEFEPAPYALSSVLTFCDMTTSPDGELVPVEGRLAEIAHRYGSGHLVSRSIRRATPMILRAVEQVRDRAAQRT
jgi:hypothetical protein